MDCFRGSEFGSCQGDDQFTLEELGFGTDDELYYLLQDATPLKDCDDIFSSIDVCGSGNKRPWESTCLAMKFRRTLQFKDRVVEPSFSNEDPSLIFSNSKEWTDAEVELMAPSGTNHIDHLPPLGFKSLDEVDVPSFIDEYLDINDNGNSTGMCDNQSGNATEPEHVAPELPKVPHDSGVDVVEQQQFQAARKKDSIVFEGQQSFLRMTMEPTSSIAYPFLLIKPYGPVTLKDINRRILMPPPLQSPQLKKDPSACHPKSALSEKIVLSKVKILTRGGKGSITIMQTKS